MARYLSKPFDVKNIERGVDAIKFVSEIKAGEFVANGYNYSQAPLEEGEYSLWQLVDDNNCHRGFIFEKEA